jgi:hypothetical protein
VDWPGLCRAGKDAGSPYPRGVPKSRFEIAEEAAAKKAFAWAMDWPGLCRAGKDAELARAAVIEYASRYRKVAKAAGLELPDLDAAEIDIVESVGGGTGTEFGVPSAITMLDHRKVTPNEAERLASLVEAAWTVFDRVAATSPAELRKGPRGGSRTPISRA